MSNVVVVVDIESKERKEKNKPKDPFLFFCCV